MYGKLAVQLSRAQSRKSQRLLTRSRDFLENVEPLLKRSERNLARSYNALLEPRPSEAGRSFVLPVVSEVD